MYLCLSTWLAHSLVVLRVRYFCVVLHTTSNMCLYLHEITMHTNAHSYWSSYSWTDSMSLAFSQAFLIIHTCTWITTQTSAHAHIHIRELLLVVFSTKTLTLTLTYSAKITLYVECNYVSKDLRGDFPETKREFCNFSLNLFKKRTGKSCNNHFVHCNIL